MGRDDAERAPATNRAQPRRGPRPGQDPTGWPVTRVALVVTVAVALAATGVLLAVLLVG